MTQLLCFQTEAPDFLDGFYSSSLPFFPQLRVCYDN